MIIFSHKVILFQVFLSNTDNLKNYMVLLNFLSSLVYLLGKKKKISF